MNTEEIMEIVKEASKELPQSVVIKGEFHTHKAGYDYVMVVWRYEGARPQRRRYMMACALDESEHRLRNKIAEAVERMHAAWGFTPLGDRS